MAGDGPLQSAVQYVTPARLHSEPVARWVNYTGKAVWKGLFNGELGTLSSRGSWLPTGAQNRCVPGERGGCSLLKDLSSSNCVEAPDNIVS